MLTGGEEDALMEHLRDEAGAAAVTEHIRAGGSYTSYVTAWFLHAEATGRRPR